MCEFFTKEQYDDLNQKIRDNYYSKKKIKTNLVPTKNNPSYLKHKKVVLILDVLDAKGCRMTDLVEKKENKIEKHKIKLYHIGDKKKSLVSLGYDKQDDIFLYPGIDFGGLTSIGQTPGDNIYNLTKRDFYRASKGKLFKSKFFINGTTNINLLNDSIYTKWRSLSKKDRFYGDMKNNLLKVLESVKAYLKKTKQSAYICFYQLKEQHAVMVKQSDIKNKLGNYMVRTFSGNDDMYAKECKIQNLYTVVKEKYANLNINLNNIRNEYSTY